MLPIVGSILSSVLGGGSAPSNTTATSQAGDATSALSLPFNFSGNVQAGGKANQQNQPVNQTAATSAATGAGGQPPEQTTLYVALGVAGLALVVAAMRGR